MNSKLQKFKFSDTLLSSVKILYPKPRSTTIKTTKHHPSTSNFTNHHAKKKHTNTTAHHHLLPKNHRTTNLPPSSSNDSNCIATSFLILRITLTLSLRAHMAYVASQQPTTPSTNLPQSNRLYQLIKV